MLARGPLVDDTGFPEKGPHSVGLARRSCGRIGELDNCRVLVGLSVTPDVG